MWEVQYSIYYYTMGTETVLFGKDFVCLLSGNNIKLLIENSPDALSVCVPIKCNVVKLFVQGCQACHSFVIKE